MVAKMTKKFFYNMQWNIYIYLERVNSARYGVQMTQK